MARTIDCFLFGPSAQWDAPYHKWECTILVRSAAGLMELFGCHGPTCMEATPGCTASAHQRWVAGLRESCIITQWPPHLVPRRAFITGRPPLFSLQIPWFCLLLFTLTLINHVGSQLEREKTPVIWFHCHSTEQKTKADSPSSPFFSFSLSLFSHFFCFTPLFFFNKTSIFWTRTYETAELVWAVKSNWSRYLEKIWASFCHWAGTRPGGIKCYC